jgi:hypothetical protein
MWVGAPGSMHRTAGTPLPPVRNFVMPMHPHASKKIEILFILSLKPANNHHTEQQWRITNKLDT